MGPGQAGTWNKLVKPDSHTQGMQKSREQKNGSAGSEYIPSVETPNRPEQAGGMKSETSTTHKIGNGNVKKTGYKTPSADVRGADMMGGKGMGGY